MQTETGLPYDVARRVVLYSRKHGVPVSLSVAVMYIESNYRQSVMSSRGAVGLFQLMPRTARSLEVNPHVPEDNVKGGILYLAKQKKRFGTWELALAAYNAGPGAVVKYGGLPPYAETTRFVRTVQKKKEALDAKRLCRKRITDCR